MQICNRKTRGFSAALAACLALCSPALALSGDWASTERVEARLVSAVEATGDLTKLPLALELHLKPGWKTYWRSPGEAGLPPALDFGTSGNVASATLAYPIPHRFTLLGLDTFGYKDDITLPLDLAVQQPGRPLELQAKLDILVCAEICVPDTLQLALKIPAGAPMPGPEAALVNRFAALVPGDGRASGLAITQVTTSGTGKDAVLEITATAREPFQSPDILAESEDASFGRLSVTLQDNGHAALIRLPMPRAGKTPLVLTLVDGNRAVEARPDVVAAPAPSLWQRLARLLPMLGLGLIGGFILNFMPCVLPVLSLKLLSVVRHGGSGQAQVRAGFLAAAAGIITSFLVIAAALVALKAAGQTIGWGIQFQQPVFIAIMAALLVLFACNLWGLFEVGLPSALANRLGQAGGTGLAGHFASGAFATLLATPCSAPFLGTAVGFALSGGPPEVFAIFAALGIGLALPWLMVAARPSLATRLPRPGMWMVRLRQILGFALAATALWLLVVMQAQTGFAPALALAVAMALLVSGLSWRAGSGTNLGLARFGGMLGIACLALASASLPAQIAESREITWAKFDPDSVKSLVSQGKTILVDITADWCLTCQANKRLVLDRPVVAGLISGGTIVPMKADWTRPDPKIAAFLARYGKFGIPFNIIYGPGAPAGLVLPELLTEQAVTEALAKAKG